MSGLSLAQGALWILGGAIAMNYAATSWSSYRHGRRAPMLPLPQ